MTPPDPYLKGAWFQPFHLSSENPVSKLAFRMQRAPLQLGARGKTTKILKKVYGKYKMTERLEIMPIAVQNALATKYHYYGTWPSSGILSFVYCLVGAVQVESSR